jgi:hypothetical protein
MLFIWGAGLFQRKSSICYPVTPHTPNLNGTKSRIELMAFQPRCWSGDDGLLIQTTTGTQRFTSRRHDQIYQTSSSYAIDNANSLPIVCMDGGEKRIVSGKVDFGYVDIVKEL